MKSLKVEEKKPLKIFGNRQNCYIVDGREKAIYASSTEQNHEQKKYISLERVQTRNGFYEELVAKDYPINSASVTSYADGADYRRDPAAAIANAPKRVNLGDISEAQDFIRSNPQEAAIQYKKILDRVEQYFAAQEKNKKAVTVQAEKKEGE